MRSTTLKSLVSRLRDVGAREIHVRVACPPIIAPCFYGIDMSTLDELFATRYVDSDGKLPADALERMARDLKVDSLRYLTVDDLAPTIGTDATSLCLGCVSGRYPTRAGTQLFEVARENRGRGAEGRIFK